MAEANFHPAVHVEPQHLTTLAIAFCERHFSLELCQQQVLCTPSEAKMYVEERSGLQFACHWDPLHIVGKAYVLSDLMRQLHRCPFNLIVMY